MHSGVHGSIRNKHVFALSHTFRSSHGLFDFCLFLHIINSLECVIKAVRCVTGEQGSRSSFQGKKKKIRILIKESEEPVHDLCLLTGD